MEIKKAKRWSNVEVVQVTEEMLSKTMSDVPLWVTLGMAHYGIRAGDWIVYDNDNEIHNVKERFFKIQYEIAEEEEYGDRDS